MQASTSTYVEPTTRSRTLLFLSYRDSSSSRVRRRPRARARSPVSYYSDAPNYAEAIVNGERQGLINGAEDMAGLSGADADTLPPMWCVNSTSSGALVTFGLGAKVECVSELSGVCCVSRVDLSEQVEDILAGTALKSMVVLIVRAGTDKTDASSDNSIVTGEVTRQACPSWVHRPFGRRT